MATWSPRVRLGLDLAIVAVLICLGALLGASAEVSPAGPWDTIVLPVAILPLLLRRRSPVLAGVTWSIGIAITSLPPFAQGRCGVVLPAAMLIIFALAVRESRRTSLTVLGLMGLTMLLLGATDEIVDNSALGFAFFFVPLSLGTWFAGRVVVARERVAAELRERTHELEHRREQTAELAVEIERAQLATDLDDAARARVGHAVTVARGALAEPHRAASAFTEIERECRASLNQMRSLLGVLRSDERGRTAPSPIQAPAATVPPVALPRPETGRRRDLLVPLGLAALSTLELVFRPGGPDARAVPFLVIGAFVPLTVRRRWPVPALAVVGVVVLAAGIMNLQIGDVLPIAPAVLVYTCARERGLRIAAPAAIGMFLALTFGGGGDDAFVPSVLAIGTSWWVGRQLRRRDALLAELRTRNLELEQEEATFAALSVRRERARIAHELHDIVAHHLAVMAVQAGAGRIASTPDVARDATSLDSICESGASALTEMDRLMEVLHDDDRPPAGDRFAALVRQMTSGGVRLDATLLPEGTTLPERLDDLAYRIVQEGLTNALKHARGAEVAVRVVTVDDALEVEVRNGRPTEVSDLAGTGSGMGLAGMRARVADAGGELEAGPTETSDWCLRARLPLAAAMLA